MITHHCYYCGESDDGTHGNTYALRGIIRWIHFGCWPAARVDIPIAEMRSDND